MKTQQYENIYQKSETKEEGSLLQAVEWNTLADAVTSAQTKINSLVEDVASASTSSSSSEPAATTGNVTIGGQDNDSHMYLNSKGNLCIETTVNNVPQNKKGKINIEAKDDIQLKPGDDIILQSDHREISKQDSILIKAVNGEDDPVELKINASNVTFSAKDKGNTYTFQIYSTLEEAQIAANDGSTPTSYTISDQSVVLDTLFVNKRTYTLNEIKDILGTNFLSLSLGETKVIKISRDQTNVYYVVKRKNDPENVINLNVEDNEGNEGYLKVRAQAIDLRCEGHGGVALQPKGYDGDSHMNKIKFEHGGGDGLEFGTFNTEKTSIFTDEYRFNKNGVWKMATRTTEASDKADSNDSTTSLKYVKQSDDFYDIINNGDPQATTEDIIKAASAISGVQYDLQGLSNSTLKNNGVIVVNAINHSTTKYLSIPSYTLNGTNNTYQNQMVNIAPRSVANMTPTVYEIGRCNVLDLVKLVNYFKANNLGPWEASNEYDEPVTISDDSSYTTWNNENGHNIIEESGASEGPISAIGDNHNAGGIG